MQVKEVDIPQEGKGQVLVNVLAASVNPIDWKMRRGMLASMFPLTFPRTLGRDCAGEAGGTLFAGVADMRTDGTRAEFALLPENQCAPLPPGLDCAAAASLCVAGLSAYIPLAEIADLKKGQKILIHAGAGGTDRKINPRLPARRSDNGAYVASRAAIGEKSHGNLSAWRRLGNRRAPPSELAPRAADSGDVWNGVVGQDAPRGPGGAHACILACVEQRIPTAKGNTASAAITARLRTQTVSTQTAI